MPRTIRTWKAAVFIAVGLLGSGTTVQAQLPSIGGIGGAPSAGGAGGAIGGPAIGPGIGGIGVPGTPGIGVPNVGGTLNGPRNSLNGSLNRAGGRTNQLRNNANDLRRSPNPNANLNQAHVPVLVRDAAGQAQNLGGMIDVRNGQLFVSQVDAAGLMGSAGFQVGDQITAIDRNWVRSPAELSNRLAAAAEAGGNAFVYITRDGVNQWLNVDFAAAARPLLGVEMNDDGGRVVLSAVTQGSAAVDAGLQVGDQVLAINGSTITTAADMAAQVAAAADVSGQLEIDIVRDGVRQTVQAVVGQARARSNKLAKRCAMPSVLHKVQSPRRAIRRRRPRTRRAGRPKRRRYGARRSAGRREYGPGDGWRSSTIGQSTPRDARGVRAKRPRGSPSGYCSSPRDCGSACTTGRANRRERRGAVARPRAAVARRRGIAARSTDRSRQPHTGTSASTSAASFRSSCGAREPANGRSSITRRPSSEHGRANDCFSSRPDGSVGRSSQRLGRKRDRRRT